MHGGGRGGGGFQPSVASNPMQNNSEIRILPNSTFLISWPLYIRAVSIICILNVSKNCRKIQSIHTITVTKITKWTEDENSKNL